MVGSINVPATLHSTDGNTNGVLFSQQVFAKGKVIKLLLIKTDVNNSTDVDAIKKAKKAMISAWALHYSCGRGSESC